MKLPLEKFVPKEKCTVCGHLISSHRPTNTSAGIVIECKALDAAGDTCACAGPDPVKPLPVVWSR